MFGSVGRVAERFAAAGELAHVRLFTRVRPQVSLEVLQTRIGFGTSFKLQSIEQGTLEVHIRAMP
jgi:hypothetical protein